MAESSTASSPRTSNTSLSSAASMPATPDSSTVIVAGAGPVGLMLTLRLAQMGVPVTLLEAQPQFAELAKAYAYMPTLFPEFKKAGIWDDLVSAAAKQTDTGIYFRVTSDVKKSIFEQMPKAPGMPGPLLLPQHHLQHIIVKHIKKHRHARVLMGRSVTAIETSDSCVTVKVQAEDGSLVDFTASYLVGTDGGKSAVRRLSGIEFEGDTLPQQLIATDVYYPFDKFGWDGANFMVDAKYYGLIGPIDDNGLWRVSFGLPHESTQEEIDATIPEYFNAMFPGDAEEGPKKYKLDRVAAYKAQQLCVPQYRKGRIILAGDAAHLTNPYIGMGLATGFLDATSLAEALSAVMQRSASDKLLDQWGEARSKVFKNFIDPLSRAAFRSVQDPDITTFSDRHPLLAKMKKAGPGAKPHALPVVTDVTSLEGYVAA